MKKYEEAEKNFASRYSYFRIDYDAAFIHVKNDQFKPGYNIQATTIGQIGDLKVYESDEVQKTHKLEQVAGGDRAVIILIETN